MTDDPRIAAFERECVMLSESLDKLREDNARLRDELQHAASTSRQLVTTSAALTRALDRIRALEARQKS